MEKLNLSALTNTGKESTGTTKTENTPETSAEMVTENDSSVIDSPIKTETTETTKNTEVETNTTEQKKAKSDPEEIFLNYESEMNKVDFNPKELLNKKLGPIASLKYSKIAIASTVFVFLFIISFSVYIFISTQDIAKSTKASVVESVIPPLEEAEKEETVVQSTVIEADDDSRMEKEVQVAGYTYEYVEITTADGKISYEYNENAYDSFELLMEELEKKSNKIKNEELTAQKEVVEIANQKFAVQKIETATGVFEYEYKGYVYTNMRRLRNGIKKIIIVKNALKKVQ